MSEIKTRADLFEAAAKMMRMCDAAGIPYVCKVCGNKIIESKSDIVTFCGSPSSYEFPLAIIEGRPVFVGDEVWFTGSDILSPMKIVVKEADSRNFLADSGVVYGRRSISWNPPKPLTVMVEMLREDAEACTTNYRVVRIDRIADACRKALGISK